MASENADSSDRTGEDRARESKTKPRIVGIGASAGGIKALQEFFHALPDQVGAAFVVVVHLDPESHSDLASILAAQTRIPVTQVHGTVPLEANHVFVVPPNRQLRITDDELAAVEFNEPRGQRAPIDSFFRSLAGQHGDGFAIILTGSGTDGTIGVKAIKEAGGIILVQDPEEAEHASMPRSAIATGLADFVLPVRDLATQLAELIHDSEKLSIVQQAHGDEELVTRILAHVRVRTGHDFSSYKRSTVLRRIARRIQITRTNDLSDYHSFLRHQADEAQALVNDLLISVTTFFRDPEVFNALANQVIPLLFEGKEASDSIRVWVPGCATGEEAYSIGILVLEEMAHRDIRPRI
jgi:two-component system CheB/CheR fusion protein